MASGALVASLLMGVQAQAKAAGASEQRTAERGKVHRSQPGRVVRERIVDVGALLRRGETRADAPEVSALGEPVRRLRKGPTPVPKELPAGFLPDSLEEPPADASPPPGTAAESPSTPATAGEGFLGLSTGAIPPDTAAAVGLTHTITAVNGRIVYRNRSTGLTTSMSDATFWGDGTLGDHGDPIVHYDPYANRWIMVEISFPKTTSSRISLGVSQTSDPTGSWRVLPIVADPTGEAWADRPRVGFSKNHLVITANHFSIANDDFMDVVVYTVDRASVYANGPASVRFFAGEATENFFGSTAPAATYDPEQTVTYLVETGSGSGSRGFGFLLMHAVSGPPADPVLFDIPSAPVTTDIWASRLSNPNLLPQAATAVKLDAGNDEIGWAVYRNGLIWVAHTVFYPASAPTRSAIQWWALSPTGARVQRGVIDSGNTATMYAYPSIAVNKRNDVVIGFSRFAPTAFPTAVYSFRAGTDIARSIEAPATIKTGEAAYQVPCTPSDPDDRCRWGDYSASSVDPANDLDLWTTQQYSLFPPSGRAYQMGLWWQKVVPPTVPAGNFAPLAPSRLLDTRSDAPLGADQVADLVVLGRGGVPASGVTAVALNVTVTQPTGSGYLTLYPSGGGLPLASNLNFAPGQTVANLVAVKVGNAASVRFYASATTHIVVDVQGWFGPGATARFSPLVPGRLLDTREGLGAAVGKVADGVSVEVVLLGQQGVPAAGVDGVALNVTVTEPEGPGFATVFPSGTAPPTASNLNYVAGQTVPNLVFARLGADGRVRVLVSRRAHVVVDVLGWFGPAAGAPFVEAHPVRLLDTRPGADNLGAAAGPVGAGAVIEVQVLGRGSVPLSGVAAVVLNVTVTEPSGPGFLTLFPSGTNPPTASNLNFTAGQTVPNLVVAKPGPDGKIRILASAPTHVVADVAGWFAAA